ncbi:MAG: hypothetical protein IT480_13595 [Gammaproteobacteria bacterium]|nr:hypothetical protein [Gammaproteobacteria bacterium]
MIATPAAPVPMPGSQWDATALAPVREINEQVIELLCAAAAGGAPAALPALVRREFLPATPAARRRLADCPYLLLDAGFARPERWGAAHSVQDRPGPVPAGTLALDCGVRLARRALLLGWHLARSNRLAARVALGMTGECAERIAALRLEELDAIAEEHRGWVRLRWEERLELWAPLLRAALHEGGERLTGLRMRGLQLLAAESLATLPQLLE